MKKYHLFILFCLVTFTVSAHSGEIEKAGTLTHSSTKTIAGSYIVSKCYPLTKATHGIDGVLQLLQDSRLPKIAYDKQFGTAFSDLNMIDDKLIPLFKDNPPLGSVLRILRKAKEFFWISEAHTYDMVPVAWLEELVLTESGRKSYLFTLDESIGMGSYAGPVTYFYEIVDGKLKPIEYIDNNTKKIKKMVLMRSLKTAWKLVKSKNGKSKDILHIACRPDNETTSDDNMEIFLVYYSRFHFNGKQWIRYTVTEKAFWEVDGEDFPPLSKFPVDG